MVDFTFHDGSCFRNDWTQAFQLFVTLFLVCRILYRRFVPIILKLVEWAVLYRRRTIFRQNYLRLGIFNDLWWCNVLLVWLDQSKAVLLRHSLCHLNHLFQNFLSYLSRIFFSLGNHVSQILIHPHRHIVCLRWALAIAQISLLRWVIGCWLTLLVRWWRFIDLLHSLRLRHPWRQLLQKLMLHVPYVRTATFTHLILISRSTITLLMFLVGVLRRWHFSYVDRLVLLWFILIKVASDGLLHRFLLTTTWKLHATSVGACNRTEWYSRICQCGR